MAFKTPVISRPWSPRLGKLEGEAAVVSKIRSEDSAIEGAAPFCIVGTNDNLGLHRISVSAESVSRSLSSTSATTEALAMV